VLLVPPSDSADALDPDVLGALPLVVKEAAVGLAGRLGTARFRDSSSMGERVLGGWPGVAAESCLETDLRSCCVAGLRE
jgi:hypothetical protein